MTQKELEGLSREEQRGIYRLFASSYLSHPPDSDEARKALTTLDGLVRIFKLDGVTARAWLQECAKTRQMIIEFIDSVVAKTA